MIEKPFQLGAGDGVKFVSGDKSHTNLTIEYEIGERRYSQTVDLPDGTPLELAKAARHIGVIARDQQREISGKADEELLSLLAVGHGRFHRIKKFR